MKCCRRTELVRLTQICSGVESSQVFSVLENPLLFSSTKSSSRNHSLCSVPPRPISACPSQIVIQKYLLFFRKGCHHWGYSSTIDLSVLFFWKFSAVNEKTKHCLSKSLERKTSWQEFSNLAAILEIFLNRSYSGTVLQFWKVKFKQNWEIALRLPDLSLEIGFYLNKTDWNLGPKTYERWKIGSFSWFSK